MKRRKSTRSDAGSSPQEKIAKTAAKEKIDVLNIDEHDAEKSDAVSDVKSYRMACDEIRKLIEEINDLKTEGKLSSVSCKTSGGGIQGRILISNTADIEDFSLLTTCTYKIDVSSLKQDEELACNDRCLLKYICHKYPLMLTNALMWHNSLRNSNSVDETSAVRTHLI